MLPSSLVEVVELVAGVVVVLPSLLWVLVDPSELVVVWLPSELV